MTADGIALNSLPLPALVSNVKEYAIFLLDVDGIVLSWNLGVLELLGFEEDEWIGRDAGSIFTFEDRVRGVDRLEMEQAREHGEAMDDRWHVRKNGTRFWANGIMHALKDEDGTLTGYMKIMRDQTEKRIADARLRESEERFTTAFRSNPSPILLLKLPSMRVLDANDAFAEAFLISRSEIIGRTLEQIGAMPSTSSEELEGAMELGRSLRVESAFERSDGEKRRATFAFEPITLAGEPHAVMLMHDITLMREAQDLLEQEREFVAAILDSLPGVFYMMDGERLIRWNKEFERVTGLGPDELKQATAADVIREVDAVRSHIAAAFETGSATMEGHLLNRSGTDVPYLLTGRRIQLAGRAYVLGIGIDMREQADARQVLERRALEQTVYADLAASTLTGGDLQPAIDLAVKQVSDALGGAYTHVVQIGGDGPVQRSIYGSVDVIADPLSLTDALIEPKAHQEAFFVGEALVLPPERLAEAGLGSGVRAPIRTQAKSFGYLEALSAEPDAFTDDHIAFLGGVAFLLSSAVEQERLRQELELRAETDDLTGLLKRVAFEHRLVAALGRAERQSTKVAVLFLDLDAFKQVNDTWGHETGDLVLTEAASRIQGAVRSWDVVARHGGDEFVMFLPDIKAREEIEHVTARLIAALAGPFEAPGKTLSIGCTIGIAVYPDDGTDTQALLRAADLALYTGKALARNNYHFYGDTKRPKDA